MKDITQLPESDDNLPAVKLTKMVNECIYNSGLCISPMEIVGVLEMCKHQYMFDIALDSVEWEE